ncbi:MAG: hypothetical protein ACYC8V_04750 [Caulobacteraceae bacterium]
MRNGPSSAVLGFRPHTYWTAVVALEGPASAPRVIERRRIEFALGAERFAFHRAAEAGPARAAEVIAEAREAAAVRAADEIGKLVADLQRAGVSVRTAAVPVGIAKLPERLEDILGVHSRIHAAEGNFYRDVVAGACRAAGLEVRRVVERELHTLACDRLGEDRASLDARLKRMGAALGPPWSEDQKLATMAAWLHLLPNGD